MRPASHDAYLWCRILKKDICLSSRFQNAAQKHKILLPLRSFLSELKWPVCVRFIVVCWDKEQIFSYAFQHDMHRYFVMTRAWLRCVTPCLHWTLLKNNTTVWIVEVNQLRWSDWYCLVLPIRAPVNFSAAPVASVLLTETELPCRNHHTTFYHPMTLQTSRWCDMYKPNFFTKIDSCKAGVIRIVPQRTPPNLSQDGDRSY